MKGTGGAHFISPPAPNLWDTSLHVRHFNDTSATAAGCFLFDLTLGFKVTIIYATSRVWTRQEKHEKSSGKKIKHEKTLPQMTKVTRSCKILSGIWREHLQQYLQIYANFAMLRIMRTSSKTSKTRLQSGLLMEHFPINWNYIPFMCF